MVGNYVFTSDVCVSVRVSVHPFRISFPDVNLGKYQWIFIKLGIYIDIVEIWSGIADGQILSILDSYLGLGLLMGKFCQFLTVICPPHVHILFPDNNLRKCQWIFTKFGLCIDIVQLWIWIANG